MKRMLAIGAAVLVIAATAFASTAAARTTAYPVSLSLTSITTDGATYYATGWLPASTTSQDVLTQRCFTSSTSSIWWFVAITTNTIGPLPVVGRCTAVVNRYTYNPDGTVNSVTQVSNKVSFQTHT